MKLSKLITATALTIAFLAGTFPELAEAQTRPGNQKKGGGSEPSENVGEPDIVTEVSITLFSDGIDDAFPGDDSLGFFRGAVESYTKTVTQGGNVLGGGFDVTDLDLRAELVSDDLIVYTFVGSGGVKFPLEFFGSPPNAQTLDNLVNDLSFISANLFTTFPVEPFPGLSNELSRDLFFFDGVTSESVEIPVDPVDPETPATTPEPVSVFGILAMGALGLGLKRKHS